MTGLAAGLVALMGVLAAPDGAGSPSSAQMDEAAVRFQRATEMFEENNLSGALAEFRRAQALAPNFRLLYNIGQVCYLLRDYPCALDSFSRYLTEGGGGCRPRASRRSSGTSSGCGAGWPGSGF